MSGVAHLEQVDGSRLAPRLARLGRLGACGVAAQDGSRDTRVGGMTRSTIAARSARNKNVDSSVSLGQSRRAVAASYFDVDGTLVRTNLLHPTVFYLANQTEPPAQPRGRWRGRRSSAPRMALAEMLDRRRFNELLFASYEGISQDRLLILADEAFDSTIKRALYPGARDLVQRCRAQGHEVVLVSGALDFLMERLAEHLGATASSPTASRSRTATPRASCCARSSPAPRRRASSASGRAPRPRPGRCFAYSDSYSDVPMLSVVGHPCAVNPDCGSAKLARAYGWPVIHLGKSAHAQPGCWSTSYEHIRLLRAPSTPRTFAPRRARGEPPARRHARQAQRARAPSSPATSWSRSTCPPARASSTRARRSRR